MLKTLMQKRPGYISLMAIVAAVFLFVIGIGLLTLGLGRRLYSIRSNNQVAARTAADYGLTKAVYAMNVWLLGSPTAPLPSESSAAISGSDVDGSPATYSYTVTKSGLIYSVQASGRSGSITKTVLCDLRLKSAFEYAILTKDDLDIGSCSEVNCLDCGAIPLKIGTTNNPNSSSQISLMPNSVVDGDILLGQGGIPSLVIGPGATYNNIYAVATDYDLPMPTVPDWLSSMPNQGSKSNPASITTGQYTNLSLGNSQTLHVTGDVVLYLTGKITLGNDAKIVVDPCSSLTIYLTGSFEGKYGAGVTNDTHDSTSFMLYGLASNDINIKNSDEFYGVVYAPNAYVEIYNGVKVQGSVIARKYKQDNSAKFTYDAKLRNITDVNMARFVPTHWREL
jgi:hypothetical protein